MDKPQIYDVADVTPQKRISPATRMIDALDGEYYTMRDVSLMMNCHIETLRRLCKTDKVNAPSKATKQGQLLIYLFTPEDVEEVRDYFNGQKPTLVEVEDAH